MHPRIKSFPILATAILLALVIRLFTSGLTWIGVTAFVIALLWFAFEFVRWLVSGKPTEPDKGPGSEIIPLIPPDEDPDEEMVSLVYFLSEPRPAEESTIRACVANSLGLKFTVDDPDSDQFVMQFTPPEADKGLLHFMVRIPQGLFAVLVSEQPYIENPEEFAQKSIRDKRLRNAVESHRAWLSVDLMDPTRDPEAMAEAYQIIGKILATFAGPDVLAIYCPGLQRCNEFDLSLIDTLSSDNPLDLFEEPTFEPIIEISDNNPRMAAAVQEAIDRWPEFLHAFEKREELDSDRYIVKAEFKEESNCEYMWVSVKKIEGNDVYGVLMNDPHELLNVHRGAEVSFSLDRLNDWIYPEEDGSHAGGFTLDVLADGDGD